MPWGFDMNNPLTPMEAHLSAIPGIGDAYKLPCVLSGADFLASIKPADWILKGLLIRGNLYTLTSPTNHGKTTVVATLVAYSLKGQSFAGFRNVEGRPLKVLLLCGENDQDTGLKLIAANREFGVTDAELANLYVIPASFAMLHCVDDMAAKANSLGVSFDIVVIDTYQAYWSGGDFNSNDAQLEHARSIRAFAKMVTGSPACVVPAHPVKNASKDNLVPYGGGAAMNEIDTNLTGWKDGDVFTLHHGKCRQSPFEPVCFRLEGRPISELVDRHGEATQSVVAIPITDAEAESAKIRTASIRDAVLLAIYDAGTDRAKATRRAVAQRLAQGGFDSTEHKVRAAINELRNSGHLEADTNTLTPKGKREAKSMDRWEK